MFGKYIADFYCAQAKLVIELDGGQHYEDEQIEYDAARTEFLQKYKLTVLRIDNTEINKNFADTCGYIDEIINEKIKSQ